MNVYKCTTSLIAGTHKVTYTACWNGSVSIDCGREYLSIEDAYFDFAAGGNCSSYSVGLQVSLLCNYDAWPKVNAICGSRTECSFSVNAQLFGNVCDNLGKRLVISYTCLKGNLAYWAVFCNVLVLFLPTQHRNLKYPIQRKQHKRQTYQTKENKNDEKLK